MPEKILIVDKNRRFVEKTEEILRAAGYRTVAAGSFEEAKNLLPASEPDVILCAATLAVGTGYDLVRHVKDRFDATLPCVLLFAEDDAESRTATLECGAENYLVRPLKRTELLACVRDMSQIRKLKQLVHGERTQKTLRPGEGIFDPLTGFYTFDHFKQLLYIEVKRAKRYGFALSAAMIAYDELDRPSGVSREELAKDLYGGLSVAIRRCLRDTDIPVAYTRENVLVLMPHTPAPGAAVVAKRIQALVAKSTLKAGRHTLQPRISIGIASSKELKGESFSDLIRVAQRNLREAIRQGGACVV